MAKSRGKNRELFAATHRAVLDAALRLFAEHGYDGVTAQMIAAQAGVVQGSVFHHFKTKRALFAAAHDACQLALITRIEHDAGAARSPEDRFDRLWRSYLAATADAAVRQILLLDGPRILGLERMRMRDRETAFAFFAAELQTLCDQGLVAAVSARTLAVLLFGALDQAAFEMADCPEDKALRDQLVAETAALIARLKPDSVTG